jgi:ACR3 family arsenite efflux pump ArsB
MESGLTMLLHSAIIGVILYVFMVYILKQRQVVAENRSIVLAAIVLIYMVMFGHGMPTKVNSDLF